MNRTNSLLLQLLLCHVLSCVVCHFVFKDNSAVSIVYMQLLSLISFTLYALQDKWLLHSVLMLVQSWIEPLVYLQTTLDRYDDAPDMLLNKTKWVSDKLISLEQGVVVLIKKVGKINQFEWQRN